MRRTPLAMMRDARREFGVADARGRDVGDGQAAVGREPFGMRALARARAAENEGEVAVKSSQDCTGGRYCSGMLG